MDPVSSALSGAILRPVEGGAAELRALLRDGRVLRAEVLRQGPTGSVVLAIGRYLVPAGTDLRLDPGARFLVRVEQAGAEVVLKILAAEGEGEPALLRALRGVLGQEQPIGPVLGELRGALREAAARGGLGARLGALAHGLEQLLARATGPEGGARLLATLGHGHEALLAAALAQGGRTRLVELRESLKALLLGAEGELATRPETPAGLREAVAQALAGLEAEQLLNLARKGGGEPLLFSFPVPDGDRFGTARLLVHPREARPGDEPEDGQRPAHLVLGLELSGLGPLRADLSLAPGRLAVQVLATRPETARAIAAHLDELRGALATAGRTVELGVRVAARADVEAGLDPLDTRYLHEHQVMDVVG
ncbi:MAG TPA: flagellar hook-length control protein FliK [Planctomycetota bacterium]